MFDFIEDQYYAWMICNDGDSFEYRKPTYPFPMSLATFRKCTTHKSICQLVHEAVINPHACSDISAREGVNVDEEVPRVLQILEDAGIISDAASTSMHAEPHPDTCSYQ